MATPLQITNNIPNTTVEYTADESGFYPKYTFTVKANEGVKIKSEPKPVIKYYDAMWGSKTANLTVSDDGSQATATDIEISPDDDPRVTIEGESEGGEPVPTVDVINNIAGTEESHTIEGTTVNITITGNAVASWFFDAKASYTGTDETPKTSDGVISGDKPTYAKFVITDADFSQPITITGTYERRYEIINQTENCTVSNLKQYYKDGETVNIELTANVGFVFEETEDKPKIYFESSFGDYTVQSTLQDNGKKAVFSWQMNEDVISPNLGNYYLQGKAVESSTPPIGGKYGAINVYVVNDDNLDELAKQRFVESTGETATAIDIGNYINRIKRIYTCIPLSGDTTINLGNYNTGITAKTPSIEVITLDFGTLEVPAPNKDLTDYESDFQLFLPFKGFVSLSEYYAGKEISLQYVINIITGEGVAKLSCEGIIFQMEQVTPSLDVIYRTLAQDIRTVGGDSWNDFALYGVEPFLSATCYNSRSSERNNDNVRLKLGDVTGFVSVDDVTPIHTAEMLTEEQEMIYTALSNGVYIE